MQPAQAAKPPEIWEVQPGPQSLSAEASKSFFFSELILNQLVLTCPHAVHSPILCEGVWIYPC